jgi:Zn-dependent protease
VGHLLRIPVFVHWSAILMLFWAWMWAGTAPLSVAPVEWYLITLIVLVISLILHEIGHALAFRFFGSNSITIYLTGFGGLCVSNRGARTVGRDIVVIAAGPAMNLILAVAAYYAPPILDSLLPGALGSGAKPSLLALFISASFVLNVGLFIINMLPIFPLDGGRLVYSGSLVLTRNTLTARQIALTVSILGAIAWFAWSTGLISIMGNGGGVGTWMGTLDGFDIFLAVLLFMMVRSAMQQLY